MYQDLFNGIRSALADNNRLKSAGEYVNMFETLDRTTDEVKGHSAFISYLLNPEGNHGQGRIYLDLFLEKIAGVIKNKNMPAEILCDYKNVKWHIEKEKYIYYPKLGRIDILISDRKYRNIIIENKIYAAESEKQLDNYYDYSKRHNFETLLVYLTIFGDEPKHARPVTRENLIACSYSKEIKDWAESILSNSNGNLSHIVKQYLATIRLLTNQRTKFAMKINDTIKNNLDEAVEIEKALTTIREEQQSIFWESVVDEVLKNAKQEYMLFLIPPYQVAVKKAHAGESCKISSATKDFAINKLHEYCRAIYTSGRNTQNFGVGIQSTNKPNLACMLAVDRAGLFIGVTKINSDTYLREKGVSTILELSKEWQDHGFIKDRDDWSYYKYIKENYLAEVKTSPDEIMNDFLDFTDVVEQMLRKK